jgi:hypothetical protein
VAVAELAVGVKRLLIAFALLAAARWLASCYHGDPPWPGPDPTAPPQPVFEKAGRDGGNG